jgi:secreted PhoX family phosphatase
MDGHDAQASVWAANSVSNSGSGLFSVSEISVDQATFANTNQTNNGTVSGGRQLPADYLNQGRAMVIDMSGNVWVAGDGSSSNLVTEIIGTAVPVYQPYAKGLSNGRFQTVP